MRSSTIFVVFALALCASAAPLGGEEDGQIDARNVQVAAPQKTTKGGGATMARGGATTRSTLRGTTTTSRTSPVTSSKTTSSRSTSLNSLGSQASSSRAGSPSASASGSSSASASGSSAAISSSAMSSLSAAPSAKSSGGSCPLITSTAAIPEPTVGATLPGNASTSVGSGSRRHLKKRAKYVLWHGTCKKNKDAIARSGLRLGEPGDFTYKNAAYLSPDKSSAAGFVVDKSECSDENDYAVLQFELDTAQAAGIILVNNAEAQQFQGSISKYMFGMTADDCPRTAADEDVKAKHDEANYIWGTLPLESFQESRYVHNPFPQVVILTQTGLKALAYKGCEQVNPKYISSPNSQGNRVTDFQPC